MTKQVQLKDQAYRLLAAQKRPGESFSDVVIRLAGQKKDPWRFVGLNHSALSLEERLKLAQEVKGPEL